MLAEDARLTQGGLLLPEMDDSYFADRQSLTLGGLHRPDGISDENMEKLRALILSQPSPKPRSTITQEQLRALGWLQSQQTDSVPDVSWDRQTVGGLAVPPQDF